MKRIIISFGWLMAACVAIAGTGTSNEFRVDTRTGDRLSAGTEELTFSNLWDGDAEATVTIEQDGAAIYEGLSGEGVKTWTVDRNGRYVLTHTTYTNGVAGKVETAVFVVEGKEVPVGGLTVAWEAGSFMYDNNGKTPGVTAKNGDQVLEKGVDYTVRYEGNTNAGTAKAILTGLPPYVGAVTNEFAIAKRSVELTSGSASKPYDGTALVCHSVTTNGDGFVSGEGVDFAFTGAQTIVGSSKNAFDYAFKTGTLAGNYTITKTEGDLEVTSGEIVNPFDPDDPSKPVTPEVLAKANCITNYDGDGHSIEVAAILNPLIAANNPKITYSLLREGTYEAKNPTFTNVVSTSVWYRIEADNFSLFSTNALLKILPRSIANVDVAAIGDQTYTGSGIAPIPAVTDMRTLIGMSESTDILTSADYDLSYLNNTNVGTAKIVLSGKNNYEGSQTNTFQIVPAIIPLGPDGAIVTTGYTNAYDGAAHGVSVSATGLKTQPTVQYKGSLSAEWQSDSPTYTDVCDTQVWWKVSAPNYQSVEGTIGLKITQAANAWTTEPAIEGWTYGETAKTPVGAAKFGTVSFAYSPMPVGAAGDYTMTATVAGTANYTGLSNSVDFTIAKGSLPPGDDPDPTDPSVDPDDPGQREDPTIPFSAFEYVGMYDGEAHTIDTNALKQAYVAKIGAVTVGYSAASNGTYQSAAFLFKDAGVTSVWYKVTSANYADIVKPCKVAITNRPVTVTSGTKLDFA